MLYLGCGSGMDGVCSGSGSAIAGVAGPVGRSMLAKRRQVLPHTPPLSRLCAEVVVARSSTLKSKEWL